MAGLEGFERKKSRQRQVRASVGLPCCMPAVMSGTSVALDRVVRKQLLFACPASRTVFELIEYMVNTLRSLESGGCDVLDLLDITLSTFLCGWFSSPSLWWRV